jgi:hypothetical protein
MLQREAARHQEALNFAVIMKCVERAAGDAKEIKEKREREKLGAGLKRRGEGVSTCRFARTNKGRLVSCTLPR